MNTNPIFLKNRILQTPAKLYQYDYGQQIEIQGLDLPATFEIHFSNSNLGEATRHLGQNNTAVIPDEYLKSGEPLFGWIFLHNEEDDGETVYEFRIPVIKRASIVDVELPEREQDFISQTIAALNSAVEETQQNIETINNIKEQTEAARDEAAQKADSIDGYLERITEKEANVLRAEQSVNDSVILVRQYKDDAYLSVSQSASNASAAQTAKEEAEECVSAAEAQVLLAQQHAETTANYIPVVQGIADSVSGSISEVQSIADSANQSKELAQAAQSAAEDAQSSAETAQRLSEAAQHSAEEAQAAAESAVVQAENAVIAAEAARDGAQSVVADLSEVTDKIEENKVYVDKVREIFANPYSSEIAYPTVGSYVVYGDSLWISVTAINEPEEWNPDHWARITAGDRLIELQEAINIIMKMEQAKDMSFNMLKRVCETGKASEYFREGDVIYIPWTDYSGAEPVEYSIPFVVVCFQDVYDPNGDLHQNGMCIMSMYAEPIEMVFDAAESKRAISTNFIPGYYYYTLSNGVYTQRSVAYGNPIPSNPTYYVSNKPSAGNIMRYGFSRWSQSAYRQWLNSKQVSGWWQAQHDCDIAPSQAYTNKPGWMYGFNNDWKEFLKPVRIQTAYGESVDTTYDTFFIPSIEQMYGEPQYPGVEGEYWTYWQEETGLSNPSNGTSSDTNSARKIATFTNKEGQSVPLFMRTGHTNGYSVYGVHQSGYFYLDSAYNARRCMPACVLY